MTRKEIKSCRGRCRLAGWIGHYHLWACTGLAGGGWRTPPRPCRWRRGRPGWPGRSWTGGGQDGDAGVEEDRLGWGGGAGGPRHRQPGEDGRQEARMRTGRPGGQATTTTCRWACWPTAVVTRYMWRRAIGGHVGRRRRCGAAGSNRWHASGGNVDEQRAGGRATGRVKTDLACMCGRAHDFGLSGLSSVGPPQGDGS
jgi:hypothetical protein